MGAPGSVGPEAGQRAALNANERLPGAAAHLSSPGITLVAMADESDRRSRAIAAFRALNAQDPHRILDGGLERPKELVAAERLAAWVGRLEPAPSEALVLASHCQHLCRWELPRGDFPEGRIGYLTWRKALARRHADRAAETLRGVGYGEELIAEVRAINLKQGLHANPDTQTIEDALCLSFLEFELDEFAAKHE